MAYEDVMPQPGRDTEVEAQLLCMDKQIERLIMQVGRMEDRLQKVLRKTDQPGEKLATVDDVLVPLAQTMRFQQERVGELSDRLSEIISRVEL